MDRSDVIFLIEEVIQQDEYGVWQTTTKERKVYCQVDSVTRNEFFEAGRNGLNPEFRFTVFSGDYKDERIVKYKGKTYGIYRTFISRTDTIELYAERKGGTNGK